MMNPEVPHMEGRAPPARRNSQVFHESVGGSRPQERRQERPGEFERGSPTTLQFEIKTLLGEHAAPDAVRALLRQPESNLVVYPRSCVELAHSPKENAAVPLLAAKVNSFFHKIGPETLSPKCWMQEKPTELSLIVAVFHNRQGTHQHSIQIHQPHPLPIRAGESKPGERFGHVRLERMVESVFLVVQESMKFDKSADIAGLEVMPDLNAIHRLLFVISVALPIETRSYLKNKI
jgi:hypothetical protein